jgi:hypothetical protein
MLSRREEALESNIPSWMPRWDILLSANFYGLYSPAFDASKGFQVTAPSLVTVKMLRITGVVFDTIK